MSPDRPVVHRQRSRPARRIFNLIHKYGITESELSKRACIGRSTISDWKLKGSTPNNRNINAVCYCLNITLAEFYDDPLFFDFRKECREDEYIDNYRLIYSGK